MALVKAKTKQTQLEITHTYLPPPFFLSAHLYYTPYKHEYTYNIHTYREETWVDAKKVPDGDMRMSCWGLGMQSSCTLMVMLPPVPDTHPNL